MKIALDAMGGDYGPPNLVAGAALALQENQAITRFYLVGDTPRIEAELMKLGCNDRRVEIVHSTQIVDMGDSAIDSVRRKKDSSISRAVDLVKKGDAEAVVSAGHTGAAVAASTIKLRMLPGIDRPSIASVMPTETNKFVLIDAGANTNPDPLHLIHNAIMGATYSKHVLRYTNPSIGLMSIGTEDEKGNALTKEVFDLLKASDLNFRGNVEGHDLFENPVEVVVCDGFTGNIVLKTSEAIAHAVFAWLKHELKKSPIRMAGAWLAREAFRTIKRKTSADEVGGSPLLGVNGVTIIAHGGSSDIAIKNAIRAAAESISHQLNPHIVQEVQRYHDSHPTTHAAASA
jgi:glycerol-3-phosphate acyltransferase PlsX